MNDILFFLVQSSVKTSHMVVLDADFVPSRGARYRIQSHLRQFQDKPDYSTHIDFLPKNFKVSWKRVLMQRVFKILVFFFSYQTIIIWLWFCLHSNRNIFQVNIISKNYWFDFVEKKYICFCFLGEIVSKLSREELVKSWT